MKIWLLQNRNILIYLTIGILSFVLLFLVGIKFKFFNFIHNHLSYLHQKVTLILKIKWQQFLCIVNRLHKYNMLLITWYFIIFTMVFIVCLFCWHNFLSFDWKNPSKESIVFLWLIILSIIPFGNCEFFNFKIRSNGSLNNQNAAKIPNEDIEKNINKTIQNYMDELKKLKKNKRGKYVQ